MKTLLKIFSLSLLLSLFACAGDDDSVDPNTSSDTSSDTESYTEYRSDVIGKWETPTSEDFESLEFNASGTYIVIPKSNKKSSQEPITGNFQIIDEQTISLEGFGEISFKNVSESQLEISFTAKGSTTVKVIDATKVAEIVSTTRTEMICQTWRLDAISNNMTRENFIASTGMSSEIIDLLPAAEKEAFEAEIGMAFDMMQAQIDQVVGSEVVFTKAGTYFIIYKNPEIIDNEDGEHGISQWRWSNEEETRFEYAWGNSPDWGENSEENFVEVTNLSPTTMTFVESEGDDEDGFKMEVTYQLSRI
jgi:hypothetical protein